MASLSLATTNISDQWVGVSLSPFLGAEEVQTDFDVYRPGKTGSDLENSPLSYRQDLMSAFLDFEKIVESGETLSFTNVKAGYSWGIIDGVAKERPNGARENTVNAMFDASYRYGKMHKLNEDTAIVYLIGIDRFHYDGNGGHFMTTNNNEYGASPEGTVGMIFKFDGKNFLLVGLNLQANLEWSERYGDHSNLSSGLFLKSRFADDYELEIEYDNSFASKISGEERDYLSAEFSKSIYKNKKYDFRIGAEYEYEKINRGGLHAEEFSFGIRFEIRL